MDFNKESAALKQLSAEKISEFLTLQKEIAELMKTLEEIDAKREIKRQEIATLRTLNDCKEREINMLLARKESIEKQVQMYNDVIRPQLLNELKQAKDRVIEKKKTYKESIEKYEKIWKEYEVLYNKWPRVEERNAIKKKVELLKIELLKKKQESIELRKKAEQLHEIKVQRLEILKKEFYKLLAEQQQIRQERQQLEKKLEEKRARIAHKKAQQQQRLEEELKRQKELEKQVLENVQSDSANVTQVTTIKTHNINIPILQVPLDWTVTNFNNSLHPLGLGSFSQGSTIRKSSPAFTSTSYTEGFAPKSASQPVKSFSLSRSTTLAIEAVATPASTTQGNCTPEAIQLDNNNVSKQFIYKKSQESAELRTGLGIKKDSVFPKLKTVENPEPLKEVNNTTSPLSSAGRKKNSILSTDNIAARLKETIRPNVTECDTQSPITKSSQVQNVDVAASSSQEDLSSEYMSHQDGDVMAMAKPHEINNVNTVQLDPSKNVDQGKSLEAADLVQNPSDLALSVSSENDNPPMESDCYDFNAEYGDEMYSSPLQSPPLFESALSPVHAGFESPSPKGSDEVQEDTEQPPAFPGFGFFSQPSTTANIFGGKSSSEKSRSEKDTGTSKFSFLF